MRISQAVARIFEDEPGHQLARLHPRRVVVLEQLDPAYPAGQELVRRDFELVLDAVPLCLVHPSSCKCLSNSDYSTSYRKSTSPSDTEKPAAARAASLSASARAARRPPPLTPARSSSAAACTASTCPPTPGTPPPRAAADGPA